MAKKLTQLPVVSERALCSLLACVRWAQKELVKDGAWPTDIYREYFQGEYAEEPLTVEMMDSLCETLNLDSSHGFRVTRTRTAERHWPK
jgi:hypothetical protein